MAFGESFAWHEVKKHWKSPCPGPNQGQYRARRRVND